MDTTKKPKKNNKEKKEKKKKSIFDQIKDDINKKYGVGTFIDADDGKELDKYKVSKNIVPSPSLSFNEMTGRGGLVKSRVYLIYGPAGLGKTTVSLALAKVFISFGYKLIFCDFENRLDLDLVTSVGINVNDKNQFGLIRPNYGDEGFDGLYCLLQMGKPLFIIIDSISRIDPRITNKNADKGYNKGKQPGRIAAELNDFLNKISKLMSTTQSVLVMISQERVKGLGTGFTSSGPTGGNAPMFDASCVWKLRKKFPAVKIVKNNQMIGQELVWELTKTNLSMPVSKKSIAILYGKGFYVEYELVQRGIQKKIIETTEGGSWYEYDGNRIQGLMNFVELFENDKKLLNKLKKELSIQVNGGNNVKENNKKNG